MKSTKWLSLVLAFTMVSVVACSKDKPAETAGSAEPTKNAQSTPGGEDKANAAPKVLTANFRAEPPALDSSKSTAAAAFTIISAFSEGLYRIDKDGKPQPGLAKELPQISADGKVYTIKLREGLTYSDGSPLTAKDFDYGFKRALDPATKAQYAFMLSYIKGSGAVLAAKTPEEVLAKQKELGVRVVDELTLEIALDQPVPFFTDLLAFQTYYPLKKEFVEQQGEKYGADADKVLGAGPFKLESWNHEQNLVLVKNDKYWDKDNVKMDKITLNIVKDENTGLNLFLDNAADVTNITKEQVTEWKGKPEFVTKRELTTSYLMFSQKNVPAFKNKKIRQALSLAVDNQAYVDAVLGNGSIAAEGLIPRGMLDGNGKEFRETAGNTMPKHDPAAAKKLLQEGLQELGMTALPKFKLMADDNEVGKKSLELVLAQWKENLGVEAVGESLPHALRIQKQSNHDYEAAVSLWNGDYNDPMTFLDMWITGGDFNEVDWSNAEYDKLVKGAKAELDLAKRTQMLVDAEKILVEEMPIAPNYFRSQAFLVKPKVKGLVMPPMGGDYEFRWATVE